MHITIVKTNNGKEYNGHLYYFRPSQNWFSINCGDRTLRFSFDDVKSVITKGERVSINSPPEGEDCDEIERARKDLKSGREYGWKQDGQLYPKEKFAWEQWGG